MRIRILKSVATVHGSFQVNDVVDIPDDMARDWCKAGIAMQDKSVEPKETKAINPMPKLPPDSEPRIEMRGPKGKAKKVK